jgi:hypothetical protein
MSFRHSYARFRPKLLVPFVFGAAEITCSRINVGGLGGTFSRGWRVGGVGGGDGVGPLVTLAGRASSTIWLSPPPTPPPRGPPPPSARRIRWANAPSPHGARMFLCACPPEPTPMPCPPRALGLAPESKAPIRAKCPSLPPPPYALLMLLIQGGAPPHLFARPLHRSFGGGVARLHRLGGPAGTRPTSSSF